MTFAQDIVEAEVKNVQTAVCAGKSDRTVDARRLQARSACELVRTIVRKADRDAWRGRRLGPAVVRKLYQHVWEMLENEGDTTGLVYSDLLAEDLLAPPEYATLFPIPVSESLRAASPVLRLLTHCPC